MSVDVSGVVPEAQEVTRAAARVYVRRTRPWFVGLIVHGSAVKGDLIPGSSDIDFQLYLEDSVFERGDKLPLDLALSVQRDLSLIDPAPFRYVQCDALSSAMMKGYIGPVPGAYHVVAGRLPVTEARSRELEAGARRTLEALDPLPTFVVDGLLEHGGGRLQTNVRLLCTKVWPVLYHVLSLREEDPTLVWSLPKGRAIDQLPQGEPLGREIRAFYDAALSYYPDEEPVERALAVLETGVSFLEAARSWYDEATDR